MPKVLVAGFQHETNTFSRTPARYANFVNGEGFPPLARGDAILGLSDTNVPVGGFLRHAAKQGWDVVPALWCFAGPSGPVETKTYELIVDEITSAAEQHQPDAVYLDLHGAMVSELHDDGEGELLRRLRAIVGPSTPIVASLDLHANLSQEMFAHSDALVAYRTYPHIDMADTGERAALLLDRILAGEKLQLEWRRIPFLIPINSGCTDLAPANSAYALVGKLEETTGTFPSFAAGFPAADIADCGPTVWSYGTDADAVNDVVNQLESEVTSDPARWKVAALEPSEAVEFALTHDGPVVIADTQDNPGAGGSSRTTGMLKALLGAARLDSAALGLIHDAAAAARAHEVGPGNTVELILGGEPQVAGDEGVPGSWLVESTSDGRCRIDGPMLRGTLVDLGPSACLRLGHVRVAVTTHRAQMMDRNMFRMVGIEPSEHQAIVVKSSVHFRGDFDAIASAIIVAKAPGLVAADPSDLSWTKLPPSMSLLTSEQRR
ncbi:M81 family metallopeptidase [Rhodococcus fascians]|nr:M81 family metallopeptidase [Rhodococcus fascians]MBY4238659.1 M81 family metallopeptidase [Rhodococcus fascians]MBY4254752.1 M81 family metallopeptidase [Rhodococcus fascians]MBY4270014.1 M81 family metallopeptidase [Rhodococcus fascians]